MDLHPYKMKENKEVKELTVTDIQIRKDVLNIKISNLLQEFEDETGLIPNVEITVLHIGSKIRQNLYSVKTKISI